MNGHTHHARVTTKGQVTIPVEIRRALGIEEGDEVIFRIDREGEAALRVLKRVSLASFAGCLPATRPYEGKEAQREAIGRYLGERHEEELRQWREDSGSED